MVVLRRVVTGIGFVSIAGCADLPRDPAGTTERITQTHQLMLGTIEGAPASPRAERTLAQVAARLEARTVRIGGHGEELLEDLEAGNVDLVYGHFAQQSPWAKRVHFGAPLGPSREVAGDKLVPRFAFRHGENGWIMLVERASR